jgi:hypothetical protein
MSLPLGGESASPELPTPSFTVSSVRGGDLLIVRGVTLSQPVARRRSTSPYVARKGARMGVTAAEPNDAPNNLRPPKST